jgi:hypothetical protein
MTPLRKLLAAGALVIGLILCGPGVALASSGASAATTGVGLPLASPASLTTAPRGFPTDAGQAMKAAEATPRMIALHARKHPLLVIPLIWAGGSWYVDFSYHGVRVAEVVETSDAHVTGVWTGALALAVYARGDFATLFGSAWILVPFSLLFLVPFLDPRRPWRMLHLDAVVLESFLVSYLLFDHAQLEPAVWLAYPPMLYLLARMLWIGWRGGAGGIARRTVASLSPRLSVRVLGHRRPPDRQWTVALLREHRPRRHLRAHRLPRVPALRVALPLARRVGLPSLGARGINRVRLGNHPRARPPRPSAPEW